MTDNGKDKLFAEIWGRAKNVAGVTQKFFLGMCREMHKLIDAHPGLTPEIKAQWHDECTEILCFVRTDATKAIIGPGFFQKGTCKEVVPFGHDAYCDVLFYRHDDGPMTDLVIGWGPVDIRIIIHVGGFLTDMELIVPEDIHYKPANNCEDSELLGTFKRTGKFCYELAVKKGGYCEPVLPYEEYEEEEQPHDNPADEAQ